MKDEIEKVLKDHGLEKIFEFLARFGEYWKAPASNMKDYHGCEAGGLAKHSLNVYRYMVALGDGMGMTGKEFEHKDYAIVAFLHDVGKAGDEEGPFYVWNESEWHRNKLGKMYEFNKETKQMPHSTRSIWICLNWQMKLSKDHFHAIMYHDMLYAHEMKALYDYWPLTLLLHHADMWSSRRDKI